MTDTKAQGASVATAVHPRDASDWKRPHRTRNRRRFTRRRGLSTAWLLLFGPVFLVLLGLVVEIGNIYVAQSQLENAMEAAALAAVKEWGGEPPATSTLAARQVGVAYGNANEVAGQRLGDLAPIDTNYAANADANDNASYTGNLIFGTVEFQEPAPGQPYTFTATIAPECDRIGEGGRAVFSIGVNTQKCDDTFGCATAFEVFFKEAKEPPPSNVGIEVYVHRITFKLQAMGTGFAEFDFDQRPSPPRPNAEVLNDAIRQGYGPFFNGGASSGITNFSDSDFYADDVGTVPISSPSQSATLTALFDPDIDGMGTGDFGVGDTFVFGVDTDNVGQVNNPNNDTADQGGGFASLQGAFEIELEFSNGAIVTVVGTDGAWKIQTPQRFAIPPGTGVQKDLFVIIPGTGNYAVRAQHSVSVPSLCGGILGIPASFGVYADATAMWRCGITDVSLIRVLYDPPP